MYDLENPNIIEDVDLSIPIEYNKAGRMKMHPSFHSNLNKIWDDDEILYMINFYNIAGAEELSFALERTMSSVMEEARQLNKKGLLKGRKTSHKRIGGGKK